MRQFHRGQLARSIALEDDAPPAEKPVGAFQFLGDDPERKRYEEKGSKSATPNVNSPEDDEHPGDQSLNAGLGDDDEFHNMTTEKTLSEVEWNEPEAQLIALESQFQDLFYLADSLDKAGGMNQELALEAQKVVPDFGGVPLGYYSKNLSATRYKVAVEEITDNIHHLIIAGIAALVALIGGLFWWILGKKKDPATDEPKDLWSKATALFAQSSEAETAKKQLTSTKSEVENLHKHLEEALKLSRWMETHLESDKPEVHGVQVNNLQDMLQVSSVGHTFEAEKFLTREHPSLSKILANTEFINGLNATLSATGAYNQGLDRKAVALKLASENNDLDNFKPDESELRPADTMIAGRNVTLDEAATNLRSLMDHDSRPGPVSLPVLFEGLLGAHHQLEMGGMITAMIGICDHLTTMEANSKKLGQRLESAKTNKNLKVSNSAAVRMNRLQQAASRDIMGMLRFIKLMQVVISNWVRACHGAITLLHKHADALRTTKKDGSDDAVWTTFYGDVEKLWKATDPVWSFFAKTGE